MEKAYKFRMYPNKQQEELINKTFGCCRFIYNRYLAKRIELSENTNNVNNRNNRLPRSGKQNIGRGLLDAGRKISAI